MKTFKKTDDLSQIRVGDTLTLEDGSVHEAVEDNPDYYNGCQFCSINGMICDDKVSNKIDCYFRAFHFKKLKL